MAAGAVPGRAGGVELSSHGPQDPAPEQRCGRCGASLAGDQRWCTSCGSAVRTRVLRPPGWRVPVTLVGALVVLAVAALVVTFARISQHNNRQVAAEVPPPAQTLPATTVTAPATTPGLGTPPQQPSQTVPGAPATPTSPPATPTSPPAAPTGALPEAPQAPRGTIGSWPVGETGYTVVISAPRDYSGAHEVAQKLADRKIPVGLLDASRDGRLDPGQFIVYSGTYRDRAAAEQALTKLEQRDVDASSVRLVRPR